MSLSSHQEQVELVSPISYFIMINNIKILCWNCRGAKSSLFIRGLKDMMKLDDPTVIAILEPCMHGTSADGVCKKLGKSA